MSGNYLVSVRLMTFNHKQYIRAAIEGVLMQKTSFKVELVIGDDFSTDGTLEIIKDYQSTSNIDIKILARTSGDDYYIKRQRLGRLYNFVDIMNHCSGKYIALLDGDDYWTDSDKLQKQVDVLERNPDVSLVFTGHVNFNEAKQVFMEAVERSVNATANEMYELLLKDNPITTSSAMIRSGHYVNYLQRLSVDRICSWKMGDRPLWLYISLNGKIVKLNDITTVYRRVKPGGTIDYYNRIKSFYFGMSSVAMRLFFIFNIRFSFAGLAFTCKQFIAFLGVFISYYFRKIFSSL